MRWPGLHPLQFEQNLGQTDPHVRYVSRGPGFALFLTPDAAVFDLKADKRQHSVLRMQLRDANNAAPFEGLEPLNLVTNYVIGNDPSRWRAGIPNYARVRRCGIYPGIDLVYYGNKAVSSSTSCWLRMLIPRVSRWPWRARADCMLINAATS